MPKQWFPLESNPDVMTNYVRNLGVDMSLYQFHDVLSTEDWALEMVPTPILGVLMLFPIKEASERHKEEESQNISIHGQIISPKVYYMKQTVGNSCGTVGLIHTIFNCLDHLTVTPGSFVENFFSASRNMTPEERAEYLANDDQIEIAHKSAATEGISEPIQVEVDTHFVCFTHVEGHLYELDGRKKFPINHGPTSHETLLSDACKVIKMFMDRDPGEISFTIVALGGRSMED